MPGKTTHNKTDRKRCIVVCGPTASGKSRLADFLADSLSTAAILIDSMQVYREIPAITNQSRERRAELAGIISVTEEWSVAEHVRLARCFMDSADRAVLDAGTGMYLNAAILDIPLAPSVDSHVREEAERLAKKSSNPRRSARAKEIEISTGKPDGRGSIWHGNLLFDTTILYIKPPMDVLEKSIESRTRAIPSNGIPEAELVSEMIREGRSINPSVLESIGMKELLSHVRGDMPLETAEERMNIRTRRLAKRQIRWFDKLANSLAGQADIQVLESPNLRGNRHILELYA